MPPLSRRPPWLLLVPLLLLLGTSFVCPCDALSPDVEHLSSDDGESSTELESDGILERNPDYNPNLSLDENFDDNSDDGVGGYDDEEDEELGEGEDGRSAIDKALGKSKKGLSRSLRIMKKHRAEITVVLILFAFRREVAMIISSVCTDPAPDGKRRMKAMSTTSFLKILLFVDLMGKFVGKSGGRSYTALAVAGGPPAVLGNLLKDFLRPINPSYVPPIEQHYTFERMNEHYVRDSQALIKALGPHGRSAFDGNNLTKAPSRPSFMGRLEGGSVKRDIDFEYNSTAIVLDMTGLDSSLTKMSRMRDEITFILRHHRDMMRLAKKEATNVTDVTNATQSLLLSSIEVIILLESPGGSASQYGLAAQQIGRLRDEEGVKVTICVDTVAASGGYMMACMSSPGQLYAAPFAVLGSIGVIGQAINIHNTLQNWGVQPLVFRGGKDKAPLGMIGEVTPEGIERVQSMVDKTHKAFKQHVVDARPNLIDTIDVVATGDVWLGADALEAGLIDRLITSDEYIGQRILEGARMLKLIRYDKRFQLPFVPYSASPFASMGAAMRDSRSFFSELRQVVSKTASVIDDLPDRSIDFRSIASTRALGTRSAFQTKAA